MNRFQLGRGNPPYRLTSIKTSLVVSAALLLLGTVFGERAYAAQSLDEAVQIQLDDNCVVLNAPFGDTNPAFGQQLNAICESPPTGTGTAGGNAASVSQAVTAPPGVKERLDERRGSDDESLATYDRGNIGLWFTGTYEKTDHKGNRFEDAYDSNTGKLTVGADYSFTPALLAGGAVQHGRENGDFSGGGDFTVDSIGGAIYLSYVPNANVFVDIVGGYARKKIDQTRIASYDNVRAGAPVFPTVNGPESANYYGNEYTANLSTGYLFHPGRFTVGPRASVRYKRTDLDSYTESGSTGIGLRVGEQEIESLKSVVGIFTSAAFSSSVGVFVPQISFDYIHEFKNDQRTISASFAQDGRATPTVFTYNTQTPDRDYFEAGIGLNVVFPNNWQAFINFQSYIENSNYDKYTAEVGFRTTF